MLMDKSMLILWGINQNTNFYCYILAPKEIKKLEEELKVKEQGGQIGGRNDGENI